MPPDLSNCHQRLCRQRPQYLSGAQASTKFRGNPRKRNLVTRNRSQKNPGVAVGNHLRPPVWHSHLARWSPFSGKYELLLGTLETPSRECPRAPATIHPPDVTSDHSEAHTDCRLSSTPLGNVSRPDGGRPLGCNKATAQQRQKQLGKGRLIRGADRSRPRQRNPALLPSG